MIPPSKKCPQGHGEQMCSKVGFGMITALTRCIDVLCKKNRFAKRYAS